MAHIVSALARLKRDPLADLPLADHLDQALRNANVRWRDRLLPPLLTVRLFMIQILNGNCAIAALRQLAGIDFAPSSYCQARIRLPLQVLQSILQWLHERAQVAVDPAVKIGRRVLIADGTTHSMEDTPGLRAHFGLPCSVKEGVGYPVGKLMGLLDAATGMFVSLLAVPLFQHDMRSVISVHPMLRDGDILLGDSAFCSFAHLAILLQRGVFACTRLHQRRKKNALGVVRWKRPAKPPAWMAAEPFALLPKFLDVRVVRHAIVRQGYRTVHALIATTLLDESLWPDEKIIELYGHRWNIETCFDHLKTTMKMNVLRCKTVEGVQKELAVYLAVYNLIRLAMLRAAKNQGVSSWRISFVDAMRWLAAKMLGLRGTGELIVNPPRRNRSQLRTIRRRTSKYAMLKKSRRQTEAEMAEKQPKMA
jgi:hypothetical protein